MGYPKLKIPRRKWSWLLIKIETDLIWRKALQIWFSEFPQVMVKQTHEKITMSESQQKQETTDLDSPTISSIGIINTYM